MRKSRAIAHPSSARRLRSETPRDSAEGTRGSNRKDERVEGKPLKRVFEGSPSKTADFQPSHLPVDSLSPRTKRNGAVGVTPTRAVALHCSSISPAQA